MATIASVGAHYGQAGLEERILAGLAADGGPQDRLAPERLAPVDQFHMGGRDATLELLRLADLGSGLRVLDVGGGLGGPARTLAVEIGASVTVLDATEEFCRVGARLTELVGLAGAVAFDHGDATRMPYGDGSFGAAWVQHATMNIEDKERLAGEIHRVLRPGGRLALHEVLAGPAGPVRFPVPWAPGPEISFLRSPGETRALLTATGLAEIAWRDATAGALAWWRARLAAGAGGPPPLGLHLLLGPEAPAIARNVVRNLEEGRIVVAYGVFERP